MKVLYALELRANEAEEGSRGASSSQESGFTSSRGSSSSTSSSSKEDICFDGEESKVSLRVAVEGDSFVASFVGDTSNVVLLAWGFLGSSGRARGLRKAVRGERFGLRERTDGPIIALAIAAASFARAIESVI